MISGVESLVPLALGKPIDRNENVRVGADENSAIKLEFGDQVQDRLRPDHKYRLTRRKRRLALSKSTKRILES